MLYQSLRLFSKLKSLRFFTVSVSKQRRETKKTKPWLTVAYWEKHERVGRMYHGFENSINIYERKSKNNRLGLCLRDVDRSNVINENTKAVLKHIGDGIQVSLEDGDIWVYNKSESPVFLNGELLQTLRNTDKPRIEKLPAGYCIKIHNNKNFPTRDDETLNDQKYEEHCLRVSFVKGFGCGYKRQTIMNCPCWIELFFTLPKS